MEFRLLGPVQIWAGGQQVELKRRQERLLLAVLLLESGKAVPADRLIELLWPEEGPGNPRRALQVYVSRLRTVLASGDSKLVSGSHGYAIDAPAGRTDVELFASLVEQAKRLDDLEQRRKILADALALWRGPALADVASEDVRRRLCAGLDESRWAAQELRLTTELAMGRHQELLPELAELTSEQPSRESLAGAQMLALYRSGRQTDALAAYAELVRHLSDELGVKPGPQLRDLQVAILRQDESLVFREVEQGPRELPADISILVGRDDVLAELAGVLRRSGRPSSLPAVVCLYGAAGTGKSATAVRLAHSLATEFPDGQLFLRLQDVHGEQVPPSILLGRLLRSLGVDSLPESVEERSALLRSVLAGKAVLMVLDDAVDTGQLRPLLPADSRCAVITTSRKPLLGLEDATHREVNPLDASMSVRLLSELSGRPDAELRRIVEYCVGLPLALRIVGARLSLNREDVADVAEALADETQRLDYLVADDRAVRASLDLTLRMASPDARLLFGCLALVRADEFAPWVAAPLLDLGEQPAAVVMEELAALGLVQLRGSVPTAYGLHSLVRARAAEQLEGLDPEIRADVERRYLDAVLRLLTIAENAMGVTAARFVTIPEGAGRVLPVTDAAAAGGASWLDTNASLIHAAVLSAGPRHPRIAASLALRLDGYLTARDDRELRDTMLAAATAAVDDAALEAELARHLFGSHAQRTAPPAELREIAGRGVDAARRSGIKSLEIAALSQVAWAATAEADWLGAIATAERMLELCEPGPERDRFELWALDHLAAAYLGRDQVTDAVEANRRIRTLSTPGTRLHAIRLVQLAEALTADDDRGADRLPELAAAMAEAREIVDRVNDELGQAHVGCLEARLFAVRGEFERAEESLREAAAVLAVRDDPSGLVRLRTGEAWLALARGRSSQAQSLVRAAVEELGALDYPRGVEELEHYLRRAHRAGGDAV